MVGEGGAARFNRRRSALRLLRPGRDLTSDVYKAMGARVLGTAGNSSGPVRWLNILDSEGRSSERPHDNK